MQKQRHSWKYSKSKFAWVRGARVYRAGRRRKVIFGHLREFMCHRRAVRFISALFGSLPVRLVSLAGAGLLSLWLLGGLWQRCYRYGDNGKTIGIGLALLVIFLSLISLLCSRRLRRRAGLIGLFVLATLAVNIFCSLNVQAGQTTATLVPVSDLQQGWTVLGGTSDASCASTHCARVDEGTTANSTDYVGTGTGGTASVTDEYGLTDIFSVTSASQISINIYAMSATNANGGTLDTLNIVLTINGTAQAVNTCTPAYNTWAYCTASYAGTWTQSDVNSMTVRLYNTVNGTGAGSTREDNIYIANVYTSLTYVQASTYTQATYQIFNNQDTTAVVPASYVFATPNSSNVSMSETSDGGYVTTGGFSMSITKFSRNGVIVWSKLLSVPGTSNYITSVVEMADGGIAITGYSNGLSDIANLDSITAKLDSNGNFLWLRTWGTSGINETGNKIVATSDGGLLVGGTMQANGAMLLKYDSNGNLSWSTLWSTAFGINDMVIASDGSIVVCGQQNGSGAYVAKFSSSGSVTWGKSLYGTNTGANAVAVASDGTIFVSGYDNASHIFLVSVASAGSINWARFLTRGGSGGAGGIITTSDNNLLVVGNSYASTGNNGSDIYISKFDKLGNNLWSKFWASTGDDNALDPIEDTDGGYIFTGYTNIVNYGGQVASIFKYTSDGTMNACPAIYCSSGGFTISTTTISPTAMSTSTTAGTYVNNIYTQTVSDTGYLLKPIVVDYPQVDVGSAPVAINTAATISGNNQPFRVRMNVAVGFSQLDMFNGAFKLQYAPMSGSCSATSSAAFADVTASSTVRFYDNTNANSFTGLLTNANDPADGTNTLLRQYYIEDSNTVYNVTDIPVGQDGMWDFALTTSGATNGQHYCLRMVTSAGSTFSAYTYYPEIILSVSNAAPAAPTLITPSSGGTNILVTPSFTLRASDADSDYLQYKIALYQSDCSTLVGTLDQTVSQTGWSGQDQQTGTAYAGSSTLTSSTVATYTYQGTLTNSTTYCWKAAAIDPGGSNTFGGYSATQLFTTVAAAASAPVNIGGGTNLSGGVHFGN